MDKKYRLKLTVENIAESAGINERECFYICRKYLECSPIDYVLTVRLQKAVKLLIYSDKSVSEVASETGFG